MSFVRGLTATGISLYSVLSTVLRMPGSYFVSTGTLLLGTRSISPNVTVGSANSRSDAGT